MCSLAFISFLFGLCTLADRISRNFPHLIIPISSTEPYRVFGTKHEGKITKTEYTEISFDIPSNAASLCTLNFMLNQDPSRDSPWKLWGTPPYTFNISSLPSSLNKDTESWKHRSEPSGWVATVEVFQNGATKLAGEPFPCAKGQTAQFLLHPASEEREFGLTWFELDYPEGPHGIVYDMFT